MKRFKWILGVVCVLGSTTLANAQTFYDANRFMGSDLNGTARFIGMGGAMGALGGDITTMSTNPAGIGIYRSNDVMTSFGFSNLGMKSTFNGTSMNTDKFRGSFDNAGFVFASKIGNETTLRYVNFGFNYRKMKSFDKNRVMGGALGDNSQTYQMAVLSDGITGSDWGAGNPYTNNNIGWLSALAYNTYLIDPEITTTKTDSPYLNDKGEQIKDEEGNPLYINYDYYLGSGLNPNGRYSSREKGGLHEYDLNVAFNMNDRVYIGATLGIYSVDYNRSSTYSESSDQVDYFLDNNFETRGTGVDFKFGIIVRPFEESSFRIGAAVHTPTLFDLEDRYSAVLTSYLGKDTYTQSTIKEAGLREEKYKLVTPWKFNLSMGYTFGTFAAVGAEYEYMDYSSARMKYNDGTSMDGVYEGGQFYPDANDFLKASMKGVHNIRLGAEFKLAPEFSFRLGYNYMTASIKNDAAKNIAYNSTRTDTEYANGKGISNYTLGFGYRGSLFYADMAYVYNTYKEDFYPFNTTNAETNNVLSATKVSNNNHRVVFTLGMRF